MGTRSPKNNFYHLEYGRDHGPDYLHKEKLKIYKVSFKIKFVHLEYGRDHGPDHLHKGKLNIFEFLPPEADFFFTTPK